MTVPWEQSAEYKDAKTIVDDVAKRVASIRADVARITPKLSTYKKATLERMINEAKAGVAAAAKKNKEYSGPGKSPEGLYSSAVEAEQKQALQKAKQDYEALVKTLTVSNKGFADAARTWSANYGKGDGVSGGSAGIYFRLYKAYEALQQSLEKELAVAAKETTPSAARKV